MNIKTNQKACSKCNLPKDIKKEFYLAANDIINVDGRLSICKDCLFSIADFQNVEALINTMRMIDRPFLKKTYDDALPKKNPFGDYMRMLGTPQNRNRTYLESEFEGNFEDQVAKSSKELNKTYDVDDAVSFKITPDILLKWGSGNSEAEMYQLESFYVAMHESNSITTPQHIESLKLICKLNLQQNKALNENRINDFKNLNTQYNKVLEQSGLRPIDKKAGGESIGIRTFSQIWEEIEKDGFIEPYQYTEKQDIIDKTIMYMGNYTRKLLNMTSLSTPPDDTPDVEEDDTQ